MSLTVFLGNISIFSLLLVTLFLIYDTIFSSIDVYYYVKSYIILSLIFLASVFMYHIGNPGHNKLYL